ncbi:MAG: DUF3179 domain-containing (seleno)protein [Phycisphaerales bacterium]
MTPRPTNQPRMLTFRSGGWVLVLSGLCTLALFIWAVGGVGRSLIGKAGDLASYGFDVTTCLIPQDQIVTGALKKDALQALSDPPIVSGREIADINAQMYGKYLVPSDRVIGVEINGESRAYPLLVLNCHEIVNDTLGGVAIAVTYNPLCDSIVVCERDVAGETLTFGVSGLLYNSNLLMFDRRPGATGESLWSQLLGRAVAGPAAEAGLELALRPASVTRWADWLALHPQTTVLALDPRMFKRYQETTYEDYFRSRKLMYDVNPPPPEGELAIKERLLIVEASDERRVYPLALITGQADPVGRWTDSIGGVDVEFVCTTDPRTVHVASTSGGNIITRYAMWFAWHAMYPDDMPVQ